MKTNTVKHYIVCLLLIIANSNAFGQTHLYEIINSTWNTEKPKGYLGMLNKFQPLEERVIPISEKEGSNGYMVEALFPFQYILRSKRKTGIPKKDTMFIPFFTYSRLGLDYGFHARVAKSVKSSPILPPTNRWGLRYQKVLFLSEKKNNDRFFYNVWSTTGSEIKTHLLDRQASYGYLSSNFDIHHYSNGQPEGVFITDVNNPELRRNNYLFGDFSTNYLRSTISYHYIRPEKRHYNVLLYYQREIGNDSGAWSFRKEQENRYGRHRLGFSASATVPAKTRLTDQLELKISTESILDKNLSEFPYVKKYRTGVHTYLDIPIAPVPAIGLLVHYYRGRDYLNIRYDDPVSVFQLGISLELFRYTLKLNDDETSNVL